MNRLHDLIVDDDGVAFVMQFVDRVARPDSDRVAAAQLRSLVRAGSLPHFLSPIDKLLLRAGSQIAPLLPALVMPLARKRMRAIVGHLVAPADPEALGRHLQAQTEQGYALNVNLLGEAVLGEREAESRLATLVDLLQVPDVDYMSVKLTAVASQINHWAYADSLTRVTERLGFLVDRATEATPTTFVNFDMEEYSDLHMTVEAFKTVLDDPARQHIDAGIVLQAYLPDVFEILQELVGWANARHGDGGGTIKIRLVKGANLAMERVDAALHGWEQAPFSTKIESDASYRRCIDWVFRAERVTGVRIGIASHNLFDVAWASLLAENRGVADRIQFEMLQGMASGQAKAVNEATASRMLMYTPAVDDADFDVAIGYLFRRLEENAAPENFMRALFDLAPGSAAFEREADVFRQGIALRNQLVLGPRRSQNRGAPTQSHALDAPFSNEPDTDPSLATNRAWIADVAAASPNPCSTPMTTSLSGVREAIEAGQTAGATWAKLPETDRRAALHRVGDELAERRGEFITAMMHEASKTFAEADVEVSEAVDFARWYADRCVELAHVHGATYSPLGLIAVIPPWNFPTAIPAGGVLASLATGNTVILKPAPETARCAELVAESCWAAGLGRDVVQFVRTPDDEIGQLLVESVDAVILTGSTETADLFRSWKPRLQLFAETSGKNALIITPSADLDQAAHDLVRSAFGHAGQKCSAASLAILVGETYESARFRRQLVDAVESLTVGSALALSTDIAPLVAGGNERLSRAASALDPGEEWLVQPTRGENGLMSPGVRDGVMPGSWFHQTECFGPVLGLMSAIDLDDAITIANSSDFGLTGGIHTLDPNEVTEWADRIEIGNCYVNRPITGAIVRRQPFGGWKRSSVGPGAKAGGPNYLMQLVRWTATDVPEDDYEQQWRDEFSIDHDPTDLFCEANILRYRPLDRIGVRVGLDAAERDVALVQKAARICGVETNISYENADGEDSSWIDRMQAEGIERVRLINVGVTDEMGSRAIAAGIHLVDGPVTPAGRIELQTYVKEQALSITLHRFGNLVASQAGLGS